jgi:hypothetical protein
VLAGLKDRLRTIAVGLRATVRRRSGESDHRRWVDPRSLSQEWDERTERIARLIPPGTTVLEFGAGRMKLRTCLPDGCSYTPSDLIDRGDGTIVCDLNQKELPAFPTRDVAVFAGVLEYINDISHVIAELRGAVNIIVASYVLYDDYPGRFARRCQGWVNDYTAKDFEEIFVALGFERDHVETWYRHHIYRFVRRDRMYCASAARSSVSGASACGPDLPFL